MKASVPLYEGKTQLSTLLREVVGGGVITITRRGKPLAELRGVASERPPPRAGSLSASTR